MALSAHLLHLPSLLLGIPEAPQPPFPFYKLPMLVQERTVGFMDHYEIIQCSLISPRFRVAVARAGIKLDLVHLEEKLNFDDSDEQDEIRRWCVRPVPTVKLDWSCGYHYIRLIWQEQKKPINRLIRGRTSVRISRDLWMAVVDRNIVIYNSSSIMPVLNDYQFVLDVIFETFRVDTFCLGSDGINSILVKEVMMLSALRYRNLPRCFNVTQSWLNGVCEELTSAELAAILDNLKVSEIDLCWKVEPGVKYNGTLKTKKMQFRGENWLTLDHLFTMECSQLTVIGTDLTSQDVSSFVRKFQEGGFNGLDSIFLTHLSSSMDWSGALDEIEGIREHTEFEFFQKELFRFDNKEALMTIDRDTFFMGCPPE